jgi:signal peptidase II
MGYGMKRISDSHAFSLVVLTVIAATIVIVDQLTKRIVVQSIPLGGWWTPIPGMERIFRITHTTNSGAAFGIFPQQGMFFIVIALVVVVAIVLYYRHLPEGSWLIRISLGMQLGGAIGNLIDRLRLGYVIDFADVGFWPIFNVADACITTGVALLAYSLWQEERERSQEANIGLEDESRP